jgi:glutathione S-transferase
MQLVIGNKNYSSWSMRPWVLLKAFDIPFSERLLRFDFAPGSSFYQAVAEITPAGKVPVLVDDDGFAVWDTLAITEYLADRHPELAIWPRDARQRARARSLCAEMHAGFGSLRSLCPMNIEADLSKVGQRLLASEPKLRADLARMQAAWEEALAGSGGPFLFGAFSAADAYFAPVVMRVTRYGLPMSEPCQRYLAAMQAHPAVAAWVAGALAEQDFIADDEPYRISGGPQGQLR